MSQIEDENAKSNYKTLMKGNYMSEQSQVPPEVAERWANLHRTATEEIAKLEAELQNETSSEEQSQNDDK